ncbi:MAG: helix-turn-helix domain-containing protein [bacterium]|nr:helix-turn-helix domain-containing protein [bacterium]
MPHNSETQPTRTDPVAQGPPLMSAEDVSEWLGIPKKTLYAWRYRREGPTSLKVGRHLRYRPADVEEWLDSCQASERTS